ncbi:MAG: alkaline phosphatase family protein, partial [Tissierellia bacterium]|nr:alkaline phosphatase family protein [Tissierellia bacterium]
MKSKMYIISFDGLSKVDMNYLKKKPNFKKFLKDASFCFNVKSIYPSITYPAHTSISTGNFPNKHGIVN